MATKLEQGVKPVLRYDVRNATPPGTEEQTFYPAIVSTLPVDTMNDIVEQMESAGRIPGLRAVAVKGLLDPAIMDQMYNCLMMGYSINFGAFTIRLYLEGTTNPSGTLSEEENTISAEFILNEGYKVELDDYTLELAENDGTKPYIQHVVNKGAAHVEKNVIGIEGTVSIYGKYLVAPQDSTTHVYFTNRATGLTSEVISLNFANNDEINFNRPTAIIAGGEYDVYVGFKDDLSGRTIVSRQLVVTVVPMPNPHVMSAIAQPGQEAGIITFDEENKPVVSGTDLGEPEEVWLDVFPDGYDAGADLTYRLKNELEELVATDTTITFLLFDNQSEHPARDFKGKLARVYAKYADGFVSYVNATFRA